MPTPGPWKVDLWKYPTRESGRKKEIVVVSENLRIAVLDHGDEGWEECPFAIPYKEAEENAKLIASAPLLAERVRILREACEDAHKELEAQATYFGPHLDPENNLFRILRKLESVLEATKEGA